MKTIGMVLVVALLLTGCTSPGLDDPDESPVEPVADPCELFYFVGCDENPDAHYMLEAYGLNQFTNTTYRIMDPRVDNGLVGWLEGGHGNPGFYRAFDAKRQTHAVETVPDQTVPFLLYPSNEIIMYGEAPVDGELTRRDQTKISLWSPFEPDVERHTNPTDAPMAPKGFDGGWVLMHLFGENASSTTGLGAAHLISGNYIEFHPPQTRDGSFFGTPLIDSAIGGGKVFLSMLWAFEPGEPNAIIQVNLETGEEKEILNVTDHAIQVMDASDDYLVLQANIDDKSGIWAWSIQEEEWFFVQEGRQRDAVHPKAGGDWVIYLEHQSEDHPSTLVGYHIPTNTYHDLVIRYETGSWRSTPFGFISWDTDGIHVVAHIQVNDDTSISPFQFWGSQLYWMELPVIE